VQFDEYIAKFNRPYKNDPIEYKKRLAVFQITLDTINEQQKEYPDAKFALNKFSDELPEERLARIGPKVPQNQPLFYFQGGRFHIGSILLSSRSLCSCNGHTKSPSTVGLED
jgi:hypothetical protein